MKITFIYRILALLLLVTAVIESFPLTSETFTENQSNTQSASTQRQITATVPFILMRHGQTDYNAKHLSQGTLDIPLNEVGKAEALKAAKQLKDKSIKKIYSSNLSRAKETAEIIRKELHIKAPTIIDSDLRERNWGDNQGKPIESKNKVVDFNTTAHGGENIDVFRKRVINAFLRIINKNEEGVLIVSHGGSMRMFFEFINSPINDIKNAILMEFLPPSEGKKEWQVVPIEK